MFWKKIEWNVKEILQNGRKWKVFEKYWMKWEGFFEKKQWKSWKSWQKLNKIWRFLEKWLQTSKYIERFVKEIRKTQSFTPKKEGQILKFLWRKRRSKSILRENFSSTFWVTSCKSLSYAKKGRKNIEGFVKEKLARPDKIFHILWRVLSEKEISRWKYWIFWFRIKHNIIVRFRTNYRDCFAGTIEKFLLDLYSRRRRNVVRVWWY